MSKIDGLAIALAWPETYCKQAGGWYDPILSVLGISKNRYYKVGHAAIVLISKAVGECHYFDFGRYHTPFGHGRVRSKDTDLELILTTVAVFNNQGNLLNYEQIINEVANKEACHGSGVLHASNTDISFFSAFLKAQSLQSRSPIPYGPLIPAGTNCSRFVRSVIKAGMCSQLKKVQFSFSKTISPTPIGNVRLLNNYQKITPVKSSNHTQPTKKTKEFLRSTLPAPEIPAHLPNNVQWLAGEGAGSWFHLETHEKGVYVKRFDPIGNLECEGIFHSNEVNGIVLSDYSIAHPSHCKRITLEGDGKKFAFFWLKWGM